MSFNAIDQDALAQTPAKETALTWVKGKTWANGLTIKLSPDVDVVAFYKQYHANKALWDKAFAYLKNTDLGTIAPGKYPIDGDDVYAAITEGPSKEPDSARWEAHQNYIDLQYVIKGKEQIEVMPLKSATVTVPYDVVKDVAKYSGNGKYYNAEPSIFFLFFPNDVHRPSIKVDGVDVVKKLVIKVKAAK
ncbi:hypothetical protein GCM10023149_06540 [Mucilaginibacter gynuensis]|uniref:YhcH/YjgK/YiaL family protein n=1 Tax=Mucilaginibacter gynuensis TaxID=1302236 RepID=A0ABP8FV85_9SPHI